MKIALSAIIILHGLIHLMGFVKAFELSEIKALTLPISKPIGIVWLLAFLFFAAAAMLYILKNNYWWLVVFVAVAVSQILIFYFWQDAKFGTIANIIILLAAISGFGNWNFENSFNQDIEKNLVKTNSVKSEVITEEDLQHLPSPVQKYLNYVDVVGKEKIKNVKITFEGEMRSKSQDWFNFTSEQFNFFDTPTRLFFMKAKYKGLPTNGYHAYQNGNALMLIKLLSLIPVVNLENENLFKAETVTFFNDLCLFAPAALIDKKIKWESIDENSTKAIFTHQNAMISATLFFNKKGQLINFISDDRMDVGEMKNYRFSTPASNYQKINGYNLCTYGEAIWHYPEGKFVYGKFNVKSVEYNIAKR